ncbi:MAG: MarR family transcriptional regulator [Pseudolysinimonas sp.]|uniref:MarR family winged helix-turn-helix transcriptional regulator n=1 Tax=Pseudolysinimonas sp. TaxID=2680009 RepID=UPI0032654FC9
MTSLHDLGLSVKRLQMKHHRAANEALASIGLTIVQWDALRHLSERPGSSLHDLAVLTFQTDQAFGTLAARLEDRGLIARAAGAGRAIRPVLTAKGERLFQEGVSLTRGVLEESFGPLDAGELQQLDTLIAKLLASG